MSELLDIASNWSFWDRDIPDAVPRNLKLPDALSDQWALVIQGVRRCGKSTLMSQLIQRYGLEPRACLFLNFEDPSLLPRLRWQTLEEVVDHFESELGAPGTYFLDEIQVVEGWEKWLRRQLDNPQGRRFIISGSNAKMLSGELSDVLTGRHISVTLFPYDLDEFRASGTGDELTEFLHRGGFPAAVSAGVGDGDLLLRQYFADIVEKDIRERVGARSSLVLKQLIQMVYETAGSELSLRRLGSALGVAADTVGTYLEAAQAAYLVFACPYFDWSQRKRLVRNTKYYPVDSALRRVVVTPTGQDLGKMLECATYVQLRREGHDVYYWRGRGEVDFVILRGRKPTPLQVTWDQPTERHLAALDDFYEHYPNAEEAIFITAESFSTRLVPG